MQAAGQCTGTNSKCIGLVGLLTLPWTPPLPSEKNYTHPHTIAEAQNVCSPRALPELLELSLFCGPMEIDGSSQDITGAPKRACCHVHKIELVRKDGNTLPHGAT